MKLLLLLLVAALALGAFVAAHPRQLGEGRRRRAGDRRRHDRARRRHAASASSRSTRPRRGTSATATRRRALTRRLLPPGTQVRVEQDSALDQVDRFGRKLAYVWKGDEDVNVTLVREGAAGVWFFDGRRGRHASELLRAAERARAAGERPVGRVPARALRSGRLALDRTGVGSPRGAEGGRRLHARHGAGDGVLPRRPRPRARLREPALDDVPHRRLHFALHAGSEAPDPTFKVADAAAEHERLIAAGVEVTEIREPVAGLRVFDARDPTEPDAQRKSLEESRSAVASNGVRLTHDPEPEREEPLANSPRRRTRR